LSTWAPNTSKIMDYGFGRSRNGAEVVGAMTHHVAGTDGLDYVANYNDRNSHPTYHIADNGIVTGIVHPDRRPSSTNDSVDSIAVSVEIDNTRVGGEWVVSQAAMDSWSAVIRHHADESSRAGRAIVKNIPGQVQDAFFAGWHQQYVQTACPGPFVISHMGTIVAKANGAAVPAGNGSSWASSGIAPVGTAGLPLTSTEEDGIPGSIMWSRMQLWAKLYGGYTGPLDGVMGVNSWKGVMTNLARESGYTGPIDGIPAKFTYMAMQRWAARYGYTGPIDGVPGKNTWRSVAKALNTL